MWAVSGVIYFFFLNAVLSMFVETMFHLFLTARSIFKKEITTNKLASFKKGNQYVW